MHSDYLFELDGGAACLDFANTLDSAGEHLASYADVVAFAAQSNLLNPDDAEWLRDEGGRDHVAGQGVLARARRLRGAIAAIFSAVAKGAAPRSRDLDALNVELAATLWHARVLPDAQPSGFHWGWTGRNLDAPLWGVARSAADLLVADEQRRRVRQCGGSDCDWLFLDTSKNQSRQWCSMRSCGNRAKARRHYQRQRGLGDAATTPG